MGLKGPIPIVQGQNQPQILPLPLPVLVPQQLLPHVTPMNQVFVEEVPSDWVAFKPLLEGGCPSAMALTYE